VELQADGWVGFTAFQQDKDCYGSVGLPYMRTLVEGLTDWSSSDTSVATVNSFGEATAVAAGETTIKGNWEDYRYDMRFAPCYYYEEGQTSVNCNDCNNPVTVNPAPSATLRVRPRITSITPSRGLVGSSIPVTINGRGFRPGQTTVNPGAGITASVSSVSATQVQASFAVAADAAGGNRGVTVTARSRTSNASNFFVQIPTSLVFHEIPGRTTNGKGPVVVDNGNIVDLSGNVLATNQCGVYQNVSYVLVDQEGQRIFQPFRLIEEFANNAAPKRTTDHPANTIITDIHSRSRTAPSCLLFDEHDSLVQGFDVVTGGRTFSLTTLVSIAVGDFTGTRNVVVEIIRP
jgi:Bacterial Ig-like domain (group 2)